MNGRFQGMSGWGLTLGLAMAGLVMPLTAAQSGRPGRITGTVTTTAVQPRAIRVGFDQQVCGAQQPNEAILVGPRGALANAVVTVRGLKARTPVREVRVVNERCVFVPRVQVIAPGGTMATSSRDAVLHTTVLQTSDGRQVLNLALPSPAVELRRPLTATGTLRVGCSTHQWMRGWIVVTDDLSVVTGTDGTFTLPDLPPGRYEIVVWHEQLRAASQTVTVAAGQSVPLTFAMQ
jgi:plastocyanin